MLRALIEWGCHAITLCIFEYKKCSHVTLKKNLKERQILGLPGVQKMSMCRPFVLITVCE